ncbi:MAG: DivIVA domain-containing protein [Gordonia sp. (in: high G+C Gram-positive bacteria)]|uniref:DivIVA domain-containing protein n=1 Tax=Gordonia sp. (in: high G+C Gram-positive bacteria) TaxID=84139 RepID=UPI0039E7024C
MADDRRPLTADDIHDVAFSKPPLGRRGYNEDQVDRFLDLLEAKFRDPADPAVAFLTPSAVASTIFGSPPIGLRGYHRDEVDRFLADAAHDLADLTCPSSGLRVQRPNRSTGLTERKTEVTGRKNEVAEGKNAVAGRKAAAPEPSAESAGITAAEVLETEFRRIFGGRGYDESQVDRFLDDIAARLSDPTDPTRSWLTPSAIDDVRFAAPPFGRRGYHCDEVDELLERCRTELARLLDRSAGGDPSAP